MEDLQQRIEQLKQQYDEQQQEYINSLNILLSEDLETTSQAIIYKSIIKYILSLYRGIVS